MINIPQTQAEKHAIAVRIATMANSTAIDPTKGSEHAAMRHAEIQAQADLLVKLWDMNGWNINALLLNTATAIADAQERNKISAEQSAMAYYGDCAV
jgi:hypothetical protein